MSTSFWKLEELGAIRLSRHFQMRQFLHSEIAATYGIVNMPTDPKLAIEMGTALCEYILEPIIEKFGPVIIRSGYRSEKLNAFGNAKGLKCAANEKNYAYHIWDKRDANGFSGAAACIIIPEESLVERGFHNWKTLANYLDENLPYNRMVFFNSGAFNIGWKENGREQSIFSRIPKPHWFKQPCAQPNLL